MRPRQPRNVVILTGFCSAILLLGGASLSTLLTRALTHTFREDEDAGWNILLQWILAHIRIHENGRADALTSVAHQQESPTFFLQCFVEHERLIEVILNLRYPSERVLERFGYESN